MARAFRTDYAITKREGIFKHRQDITVEKPEPGAIRIIENVFAETWLTLGRSVFQDDVESVTFTVSEIDPKDAVKNDEQCEPDWSPL